MTKEEWLAWLIADSLDGEMYAGNGHCLVSAMQRTLISGQEEYTNQVVVKVCNEDEIDIPGAGEEFLVFIIKKI